MDRRHGYFILIGLDVAEAHDFIPLAVKTAKVTVHYRELMNLIADTENEISERDKTALRNMAQEQELYQELKKKIRRIRDVQVR